MADLSFPKQKPKRSEWRGGGGEEEIGRGWEESGEENLGHNIK